jgi:hypothetical protein
MHDLAEISRIVAMTLSVENRALINALSEATQSLSAGSRDVAYSLRDAVALDLRGIIPPGIGEQFWVQRVSGLAQLQSC